MAVPPWRRRIGAVALVVLALSAGATTASGQVDDKRAEAAAIASKLDEQARTIVALDRDHRRARDELTVADAAVARAEAELAAAARRQDDARRLLGLHAQAAYVGGGSVSLLGRMARATVDTAGARRTYLRVVAGEDRQAIGRLQAAKEDLELRRQSVAEAKKAALGRTEATVADLERLEKAMVAQRSLLARANGELAQLVAAEQARRDAEAAREAAARAAAAPPPTTAAAARGAVTTVPAAAAAPAVAAATPTTAAPAPASSSSVDATFACIRQLESGNNYSSPGGGAYQFQDATWHSLGYSGSAQDHPPAVQDQAARELLARDGWTPWTTAPLCGRV
jgi:septal ring factor EnvC (AmiA/AmiB activator)